MSTKTTAEAPKKLVVNKALRVLEISRLQTDPSYQREVKRGHKKIVTGYNDTAFGVPLVAERANGSLFIVDGLQRISAVRAMEWKTVRCEVFASEGVEHEAAVFQLINGGRIKLTAADMFRSGLAADNPLHWSIKRTVEACGYTLHLWRGGRNNNATGAKARELTCLSTLVSIAEKEGLECIQFVLNTVAACWPEDRTALGHKMFGGLRRFWSRHEGKVDTGRLWARLKTVTAQKVLYAAAQATIANNVDGAIADVIEKLYQKRSVRSC